MSCILSFIKKPRLLSVPRRRQTLRVQPVSEALHEERPPDEAL